MARTEATLDLLFDLLSERVVAYRPGLRKLGIARTLSGTILASQVFYLLKSRKKQLAITDAELAKQTELTIDEVRSAKKDIVQCGFFEAKAIGIPPITHWSINQEALLSLLGQREQDHEEGAQFGPQPELNRSTARIETVHSPKQNGPQPELKSATARNETVLSPKQNGPEPDSSICLSKNLRREEEETIADDSLAVPLAPPVAPARTLRGKPPSLSDRLLTVYNTHKPATWVGKKVIPQSTLEMAKYWIEKFGCEEEFLIALEKALRQAQVKDWWKDRSHSLDTLLRTTKPYLVSFSEEYDSAQAKATESKARHMDPAELVDYEAIFSG